MITSISKKISKKVLKEIFKKNFKKLSLYYCLVGIIGGIIFPSQVLGANIDSYVRQNMDYIAINDATVSQKLYPINNGKAVYFFWSYSFFTITAVEHIQQIQNTLDRKDLLALLQDDKVLIASHYIDPYTDCTTLDSSATNLLDAYPEKITTQADTTFLIGNSDQDIACYRDNTTVYLPNDALSRIDMDYLVQHADTVISVLSGLQWASLNTLYHYVTQHTSYDYDALDYDQSVFTPYLASSFFEKKKVVCDWYSKVFSLLAKQQYPAKQVKRIMWSRQNIDKKDEKSFLHSWVQIGNDYYDPTFDDSDDQHKNNHYYAKSQRCFNLDHYTEGRKMFKNTQERISYAKTYSTTLINTCPEILSQTLAKDNAIKSFIAYSLQTHPIQTTKKFLCDAYQICALSANNRSELVNELGPYRIQFWEQNISLSNLNLAGSHTSTSSVAASLDPKTKVILDTVIKKIKRQLFFSTPNQKEVFLRNIKMKIALLLTKRDLPEDIRLALRYISKSISQL